VDRTSEQPRLFEMQELIEDVRFTLINRLKRLPIAFDVQCPPGLKVYGSPGPLEQILTNLILNSVDHGYNGGERAGIVRIGVETPVPGRLRLSYSDDGLGMTPEVVERVFEPFFTTRRGEGGTGLGMYLSYNLVTGELGGTIQCESRPGAGVRFVIEIPYAAAPPKAPQEHP
jgi:signal transduction histidine kinase